MNQAVLWMSSTGILDQSPPVTDVETVTQKEYAIYICSWEEAQHSGDKSWSQISGFEPSGSSFLSGILQSVWI